MSKIKKADAGYTKELKRCGNCRALSSKLVLPAWMRSSNERATLGYEPYDIEQHGVEKNLRCSIHGFAIQRTAVCNFWTPVAPLPSKENP